MTDISTTQGEARPLTFSSVAAIPPTQKAVDTAKTKVEIKDLHFHYKKFHALKNINMALRDKRVTAFIGPSGCGKSTLLRVLNRIYGLYPDQVATGQVLVDGKNILDPGIDLNLLAPIS